MRTKFLTMGFTLISLSALTGCITTASYNSAQTPGLTDPFEEFNRKVFAFNAVIDRNIINPIIEGYRYVVPSEIRTGLDNALTNLSSPARFANHLLQGNITDASDTLFATVVNTLVGFGGLLDVAEDEGYSDKNTDFGKTLASWGISHGPYVVIPLLGPASTRDGIGYIVDFYADPTYWYSKNVSNKSIRYNKLSVNYLNTRDKLKDALEELERSSIDYYASVRSTYYQSRKLKNCKKDDTNDLYAENMDFPEYEDY